MFKQLAGTSCRRNSETGVCHVIMQGWGCYVARRQKWGSESALRLKILEGGGGGQYIDSYRNVKRNQRILQNVQREEIKTTGNMADVNNITTHFVANQYGFYIGLLQATRLARECGVVQKYQTRMIPRVLINYDKIQCRHLHKQGQVKSVDLLLSTCKSLL